MPVTIGDNEPRYVGATLGAYEQNLYHDSYWYAIVWTGEEIKHVEFDSTAHAGYGTATVDATPEVKQAAVEWLARELESGIREERPPVEVGRPVRSLTTRGKNVGVEGTVRWKGIDRYNSTRYRTVYRVGVEVPGDPDLRFMPADRVEVICEPLSDAEVKRVALDRARRTVGSYRNNIR